jgi:VanZ family protein
MFLIVFLSLYPLEKLPEFQSHDKSNHLVAYFFLAIPLGLKTPNKWGLYICLFIFFGGVIELIQPFVNRYGELFDFIANTIGIFLGFSTGFTINYKFRNRY